MVTSHAPSALRRWWSAAWRITVLAVLGLLLFTVAYGTELESVPVDDPRSDAIAQRMLLDLLLGIVILVLFVLRRRAPLIIPAIAVALSAFSSMGAIAASVLVVFVAARRRPLPIAVVAALYIAAGMVDLSLQPIDDSAPVWQLLLTAVLITGALILLGLLIGARRQLAETNARQRVADETARIEQAKMQERARIAREMHDVLGHRLSLMAVHAGALEYRDDLTRAQTAQAAGIISENSRRALDELRDVLGVLREGTSPAPEVGPQPVAADMRTLIDDARSAGTEVVVTALDTADIPDAVGRHLFRIAQELLTNARRHAPGAAVTVRMTSDATDGIRLSVRNPAPTPALADSPGFGLTGVAERVRLIGGVLSVSDADDLFAVEAVLPWPR